MAEQNDSEDLNKTQNCPVVHPPRTEPPSSPAAWGWKALAASTTIVMAIGATASAVNSLQTDTRTLYTELIHMSAQHGATTSATQAVTVAQPRSAVAVQAPVVAPVVPAAASAPPVSMTNAKAFIDEPVNGSVIDDDFVPVSGRVDRNVKGDVWLLIFPQRSPGRGFPQTSDASRGVPAVRTGDTFQVPAFLGGPRPQSYDLVLFEAQHIEASKRFSSYLQAASRSNRHAGISMADMPSGLKELARVTIRTAPQR